MTIYLKIKALSKRKPLIERMTFNIDENPSTSNALIEYIVRRNPVRSANTQSTWEAA